MMSHALSIIVIILCTLTNGLKLRDNPEECDSDELDHFDPPGPITGLISRPGSGVTWVRHLLHLATGYETGSVYQDAGALLNGWTAEGIFDGSVLAVKDHFMDNK